MLSFAVLILSFVFLLDENTGFSIVVPGNYYQGEAELETGENWQGLFEMDTFYELRTVELFVEDAQSPMDRDDEITGKDVFVVEEKGNLLFLIKSEEFHFVDGPVEPALLDSERLPADTSIVLQGTWEIFTEKEGLFFTDGDILQRLSDVYPNAYGEGVSVVWAGDLDNDGRIDLILNDRPHYAFRHCYRLFLSSEAEPGLLLKEVAEFVTVLC